MAVGADPLVNRLAPLEGTIVPVADQPRMINPFLVFRQRQGDEVGGRLQGPGPRGTPIAHFHQITDQVKKLLPAGQLVHLAGWHQRFGLQFHFGDIGSLQGHLLTLAGQVAQHQFVSGALHQNARQQLAGLGGHANGFVALTDGFRWLQHRHHQFGITHPFVQGGQIRAQGGRAPLAHTVAF